MIMSPAKKGQTVGSLKSILFGVLTVTGLKNAGVFETDVSTDILSPALVTMQTRYQSDLAFHQTTPPARLPTPLPPCRVSSSVIPEINEAVRPLPCWFATSKEAPMTPPPLHVPTHVVFHCSCQRLSSALRHQIQHSWLLDLRKKLVSLKETSLKRRLGEI